MRSKRLIVRSRLARRQVARLRRPSPQGASREGSTLVVVMAMLGMLVFLGLFFFYFAAKEEVSAEYWNGGARTQALDPEPLFDFALRQVIVGAHNDTEKQSVLWGGDKSLLATMFGSDVQPFSGQGINAVLNGVMQPDVDQNYDGSPDGNPSLLSLNRSPAAVGGGGYAFSGFPQPDVPYTSPDVNSPFLAYVSRDASGRLVIVPSYHRPQLLRNMLTGDQNPLTGAALNPAAANQWYTNPNTAARVLRPHQQHYAIDSSGAVSSTPRFVTQTMLPLVQAANSPITSAFPFPTDGTAGNWREGVWTNTTNSTGNDFAYEYDADADGDGTKEAVWLDLGYPAIDLSDGKLVQPMFAITIYDADALFNLNRHGNTANAPLIANPSANPPLFGPISIPPMNPPTTPLSASNHGLTTTEINPQWGLTAAPTGSSNTTDHQFAFGRAPINTQDLANMEWWFLLTGRASSGISELHPGRWGDTTMLNYAYRLTYPLRNNSSLYPQAGQTYPSPNIPKNDDDGDRFEGGLLEVDAGANPYRPPWPPLSPLLPLYRSYVPNPTAGKPAIAYQPWYYPLDIIGAGTFVQTSGVNSGKTRLMATQGAHQWPMFFNYVTNANNRWFTSPFGGSLMPGAVASLWLNEADETVVDTASASPLDAIFGADENAFLQMSDEDLDRADVSGRTQRLASINFDNEDIRKRFATASWDVRAASRTFHTPGATPNALRAWEYVANGSGVGYSFPPVFGSGNDPFRPELRTLLTTQDVGLGSIPYASSGARYPQRRMSLNGVLDYLDVNGNLAFNPTLDRLRYRPLTPHPSGAALGNSPLTGTDAVTRAELVTTPRQQEYLARYDRQRMCRDIYVMLYLLGGGNDTKNYATTSNASQGLYGYTTTALAGDQCRQMAQLAVNWVDALDPDDNITVFEYDVNLFDGWELDDNPYTPSFTNPGSSDDTNDRRVVFGVEEQQLCLNEALAIFADQVQLMGTPQNHNATAYDDQNYHFFTYLELENASPRTVDLSSSSWQILVKQGGTVTTPVLEERRLVLRTGTIGSGANSNYTLGTVGTANSGGLTSCDVYPDTNNDQKGDPATPPGPWSLFQVNVDYNNPSGPTPPTLTTIAPRTTNPTKNLTTDTLDLDLIRKGGSSSANYRVTKPQTAGNNDSNNNYLDDGDGDALADTSATNPAGAGWISIVPTQLSSVATSPPQITFQLRRRVNLDRPEPDLHATDPAVHQQQSEDNPWVVVDELTITMDPFILQSNDIYTQIQPKLDNLRSTERKDPLFATNTAQFSPQSDHISNSLTMNNYAMSGSTYTLWQWHPNRDFASAGELFSLPAYGPEELTQRLGNPTMTSPALTEWYVDTSTGRFTPQTAGAMFLNPMNPAATSSNADLDNRWYRLLEFVEPVGRDQRTDASNPWFVTDMGRVGNDSTDLPNTGLRTAGRVNLNTLRHAEVLAGLLDAPELLGLGSVTINSLSARTLMDTNGRNWWQQFLQARDQQDPLGPTLGPGIRYLPGVPGVAGNPSLPGSRPFRELSYTQYASPTAYLNLEQTLLRSLPTDVVSNPSNPSQWRRLFQVGNPSDGDPTTKYRLLSKLMNTTTTRSNVFLVFVQIEFFEAEELSNGAVRVGGRWAESPVFRSFFVVDRSKAAEGLIPANLPHGDGGLQTYSFSRGEDLDGDGQLGGTEDINGNNQLDVFDWRSLILHRQRIE